MLRHYAMLLIVTSSILKKKNSLFELVQFSLMINYDDISVTCSNLIMNIICSCVKWFQISAEKNNKKEEEK